jgi:elongation factor P--beta-lysine ligase
MKGRMRLTRLQRVLPLASGLAILGYDALVMLAASAKMTSSDETRGKL